MFRSLLEVILIVRWCCRCVLHLKNILLTVASNNASIVSANKPCDWFEHVTWLESGNYPCYNSPELYASAVEPHVRYDYVHISWWITRSRVKFLPIHYEFKSTVVRFCIATLWWPTVFEKQVKIGCHTLSFDHNLEVQSLTQCNRIGHAIVMSGITVNFESKGETSLAYERAKTITSRLSLSLKYGFFSFCNYWNCSLHEKIISLLWFHPQLVKQNLFLSNYAIFTNRDKLSSSKTFQKWPAISTEFASQGL